MASTIARMQCALNSASFSAPPGNDDSVIGLKGLFPKLRTQRASAYACRPLGAAFQRTLCSMSTLQEIKEEGFYTEHSGPLPFPLTVTALYPAALSRIRMACSLPMASQGSTTVIPHSAATA